MNYKRAIGTNRKTDRSTTASEARGWKATIEVGQSTVTHRHFGSSPPGTDEPGRVNIFPPTHTY